jgi:glycine/D-amino acid oxidase-like deaminating enzyme/nitrite reductase/ring-hydroxylating ferredoxin subunit
MTSPHDAPPGATHASIAADGGASRSFWIDRAIDTTAEPLAARERTDVCVVGAGIAGLSTAYELVRRGRRVIVLDDGPPGGGETARTTAHLASALDDRFVELERLHGRDGARLAAASHARAIDRIEAIAQREQIACDFRRVEGYLFAATPDDNELLAEEFQAAARAGLHVRWAGSPFPSYDVGVAIAFGEQGEIHPLAYLAGLARAILAGGGAIHGGVRVAEIHDGKPARVVTADGREVVADAIVVATNSPIDTRVKIHTKQASYRSYVLALALGVEPVTEGLFWDTAEPYHYLRLARDADGRGVAIVGGEDHRTGFPPDDPEVPWTRLEAWVRERLPGCGAVTHRWSGQIVEPYDGLGFVGREPGAEAVYLTTGDSGHGMTQGALAGELIADAIVGAANPFAELYDPARTTLRALPTWFRDAGAAAAGYARWVAPAVVDDVDAIGLGEGAVLRRGLRTVACYRDPQGLCHVRSAVCPHLGGLVAWNAAEKTWDCPCHGSRFDPFGRCLNGPARDDLAAIGHARAELPGEVAEGEGAAATPR